MKIKSVRITNFRSIIDSGWIPLSPDGITVFVGQNESGKTSVLEALHFALSNEDPTEDDFRIGAMLPAVYARVESSFTELRNVLEINNEHQIHALKDFLETDLPGDFRTN